MKKVIIIFGCLFGLVAMNGRLSAQTAEETPEATATEQVAEAAPAEKAAVAGDASEELSAPLNASKSAADEAYTKGQFRKAILLYEALLTQGESADIYYNLGNSYYKDNQIARAVLNYERALLLNPGDGDIRFNLEMARSKTVDKVTPMSEVFLVTWTRSVKNWMSADGWATTGIVCFLLFLAFVALYLFGRKMVLKKLGFTLAIVALVLTVTSNLFASSQKQVLERREAAIVMEPTVTAKSTPDEGGTDLFVLHEGHKVTIKDASMKSWVEIKLEDGNVGWIPVSAIEKI